MSELIHINIDDILSGWSHACDKIENDEQVGWSVGRIAQWGGHYICVIHDDVPVDEREEIAKFIASAPETIKRLQAQHDQAIKEAVEKACKERDEAMQEFVDRCDIGEVRSSYTYAKFKNILNAPPPKTGD